MKIFGRRRRAAAGHVPRRNALAEAEENPELLEAERSVNRLPPPPPSGNPYWDVVAGSRPQIVSSPDPGDDPGDTPDSG